MCLLYIEYTYISPPLFEWDSFQDTQWRPEMAESSKPYTYYVYFYTFDKA